MNEAAVLLVSLQDSILVFSVIFLRVSGLFLLLPGFGDRMIPMRVRLASALAFTIVLAPLIPTDQIPDAIGPFLIISEIAIGAAFGAILRFMVHALLIAGTIAAQATSLAQLFGAPSADPSSVIGTFLNIAGLAILMASGFHVAAIELLARSWDVLPVGLGLSGSDLAAWGAARTADTMVLAFMLAMPFVVVSVLYNLTLGIINKAMPQLMVALVGAPAITGLALVTLAATAVLILTIWRTHVGGILMDPFSR